MGAFLSPDSTSTQNLQYAPVTVSDQGIAANNGNKGNAGRIQNKLVLGKGASYTVNTGASSDDLHDLTTSLTSAFTQGIAGIGQRFDPIEDALKDRLDKQIDAGADAAVDTVKGESSATAFKWTGGAVVVVALFALLVLFRKKKG